MAAAKKNAKAGGRPPGAPNKMTLDLMSELEIRHFNVITERIRVYEAAMRGHDEAKDFWEKVGEQMEKATGNAKIFVRDPRPDFLKVADSAVADLFNYVYPKRKSVEVTGKDGEALLTSFADLMQKAANGIKKD